MLRVGRACGRSLCAQILIKGPGFKQEKESKSLPFVSFLRGVAAKPLTPCFSREADSVPLTLV